MPTCQFFDFTAAEVVRRTWKHIQTYTNMEGLLMRKQRRNINYLKRLLGDNVVSIYLKILTIDDTAEISAEELERFMSVKRHLDAMAKYEDAWWLSRDKTRAAFYQFGEPVLLIPYDTFISGLEELLGHEVNTVRLAMDRYYLVEEVDMTFKRIAGKRSIRHLTIKELFRISKSNVQK